MKSKESPPLARGLHVHAGTRLEDLAEHLVATMAKDPLPPDQKEIVVVPNPDVAWWLEREIADSSLGICTMVDMPFLVPWMRHLVDGFPYRWDGDRFHPMDLESLTWHVHGLLAEPRLAGALERPRRYFADDPQGRRQFQLAQKVAGCFDRYQLYRPGMLQAWERGTLVTQNAEEIWQAELWRALVLDIRNFPGAHGVVSLLDIAARLADGPLPVALPRRVHVFGFSTLPRVVLEVLTALGRHRRVDLLALVPTFETMEDATIEHPMLAALGRQPSEFVELLTDLEQQGIYREDLPPDLLEPKTVLQHLQQGIRDRVEPANLGVIDPADKSLLVHIAHSPYREMEILRDQLLDALEADPSLRPADIRVFLPDMQTYAPAIASVFGPLKRVLPHRIERPEPANENPFSAALLAFLRMCRSKWTSHEVLSLLANPAVRARFGLEGVSISEMQRWTSLVSIRWGIDAAHRASLGHPGTDQNTWRHGIDQIALGLMTGQVGSLCNEILPVVVAPAGEHDRVARFVFCLRQLFGLYENLRTDTPRGIADWQADTLKTLGALTWSNSSQGSTLEGLRGTLDQIKRLEVAMVFRTEWDQTLPLAAWIEMLDQTLSAEREKDPYGSECTFAPVKLMHTIPATIVAVCGLTDSFLTTTETQPFDLLAPNPERGLGNRTTTGDARQFFLEALLSARERIILSYVGASQRSHERVAASPVLLEILETIDRGWTPQSNDRMASEDVIVLHPLQPFSRRYGEGHPRLFTYCAPEVDPGVPSDRLVPDGFAADARNSLVACTLQELESFWTNPARHFLRHALGLRFAFREEAVEDLEDFEDPTKPWELMARLGEIALANPAHARDRLAQLGALRATSGTQSPGWLGKLDHAVASVEARLLAQRVGKTDGGHALAVRATACGVVVSASIRGPASDRLLNFERDTDHLSAQSKLRAWIRHVVCNAAAVEAKRIHGSAAGIPVVTQVVMPSRTISLEPLGDEAHACLESLVEPFVRGHREPIPFFPKASSVLAKVVGKGRPEKSDDERLDAAREGFMSKGWNGKQPEGEDPYIHLCWRGIDPFAEPWAGETLQLARKVFGPLQAHLTEGATE